MTIENEDDARSRAEDALEEEGYDDATITDEPYENGNVWIVPADHAGGELNLHIETDSETVEIAELGE